MKKLILIILILIINLNANEECEKILKNNVGEEKEREIFLIIDRTTPFSEQLRKDSVINIFSIIKSKTVVNLFTFSEYKKGGFIDFVDRYYFYDTLSKDQRYEISKSKLKEFDQCLKLQSYGLRKKLANDIFDQFKIEKENFEKSEIFYSLKQISKEAVVLPKTKEKIVFILSDMLENSSYTSFYGKPLKNLNIKENLTILDTNNLFGNFDQSDIIVVGAGTIDSENYRDGKDQDKLKDFWKQYFKKSNGNLKIFTNEIKYPIKELYK